MSSEFMCISKYGYVIQKINVDHVREKLENTQEVD